MKSHTDQNGKRIEKYNRVLIDGKHPAAVVVAGAVWSLLSHRRSDGEPGWEQDWYANDQLTISTKEMQAAWTLQRELDELKQSDAEAQAHSDDQLSATYA